MTCNITELFLLGGAETCSIVECLVEVNSKVLKRREHEVFCFRSNLISGITRYHISDKIGRNIDVAALQESNFTASPRPKPPPFQRP